MASLILNRARRLFSYSDLQGNDGSELINFGFFFGFLGNELNENFAIVILPLFPP